MIILNYDKLDDITETLFNHLLIIIDIHTPTTTLNITPQAPLQIEYHNCNNITRSY